MIFLLYAARIILISGLLYTYYWVFLRNRLFHQYNRYFLLAIPVFSLILPLIHIPIAGLDHAGSGMATRLLGVSDGDWEQEVIVRPRQENLQGFFTVKFILAGIYVLVSVFLLLGFGRSLAYIRKMAAKYEFKPMHRIRIYQTDEPGTPFSFFNLVFWNHRIDLESRKGMQIFRHELYHVKQNHSADILFLECIHILCWFNPFFHGVRKEIKAIHEFLADEYASKGHDRHAYAELLLARSIELRRANMLNPFFQNQIKRRITMITKNQAFRTNPFSRVMILPLAFLLFCAFAVRTNAPFASALHPKNLKVIIDAGHGGTDRGAVTADGLAEKDIALSISKKIKSLAAEYQVQVVLTRDQDELSGNTQDSRQSLSYRAGLAAKEHADLFLSIHLNSDHPESRGFQIWVSDQNPESARSVVLGSVLAETIRKDYAVAPDLKRRPTGITVLKSNSVPAVLMECGNLGNAQDEAFITDEKNQEIIARDILAGLAKYGSESAVSASPAESYSNPVPPMVSSMAADRPDQDSKMPVGPVFTKVEVESEFPGGQKAWTEYLNTHLRYPDIAINKEIQGDVLVQFLVDKLGNVRDVKALSGPEELKAESIRIIKESGKWTPAREKGKKVNCYKKQPIRYRLERQ